MKFARIYCLNDGPNPFDISGADGENVYAIGEWELKGIGSSVEQLEKETGKAGKWLILDFRPARAGLDRAARQLTLVGDAITGFRNDPLLLPSANFATFVKSWRWDDDGPALPAISADEFENLHPNVSDRIRMGLERHIRPNISSDPDFFQRLRGSSPPSSETSPSGSEPTTSTPESAPS